MLFQVDEGIHGIEARASVEKSEIDIDDKVCVPGQLHCWERRSYY